MTSCRAPNKKSAILRTLRASNGGAVSSELLREVLWPDGAPDCWLDLIRGYVRLLCCDGHPVERHKAGAYVAYSVAGVATRRLGCVDA